MRCLNVTYMQRYSISKLQIVISKLCLFVAANGCDVMKPENVAI